MKNNPFIESVVVKTVLDMIPPLLRNALFDDPNFQAKYSISTDAKISYGDEDISFLRSKLYNSVRDCLSDSTPKIVRDIGEQNWELRNITNNDDLPKLLLTSGKRELNLSNLTVLSLDRKIRLKYLNKVALELNLVKDIKQQWEELIKERSLKDDEVIELHSDINDSPLEQERNILYLLSKKNNIEVTSLVPSSRRYYERLVGTFDGSSTIQEYVSGVGKAFFEQLLEWDHYAGFLYCLLLSSHLELAENINVEHMNNSELLSAYELLERQGDIISQLGAIEVGLRIVKSRPNIAPILVRLLNKIISEDPLNKDSSFNLIFSLFVLVDGELARSKIFVTEPPFYRRLAAMSHSALIYRQIIKTNIDINSFCDWALSVRGDQFYLQSLLDIRTEPAWYPDFAGPTQIKYDMLGRILITGEKYKNTLTGDLSLLIFNDNPESVLSRIKIPESSFPGPLEGSKNNLTSLSALPDRITQIIKNELNEKNITATSFNALVNSVLIFSINDELVELAAKAIRRSGYQLSHVHNKDHLMNLLNGLAMVAAITRSQELTKELRILLRNYREGNYALAIDEVFRICIISSSSCENNVEWRKQLGDWLTELAFGNLSDDEANILLKFIRIILNLNPELRVTCGRAEAALCAFLNRSS